MVSPTLPGPHDDPQRPASVDGVAAGVTVPELTARIEALTRQNGRLREFAHVVAHDLQAPLRRIGIFTGLLRDQLATGCSERSDSLLRRIEASSQRGHELVSALLTYARATDPGEGLQPVDMNLVLSAVLQDLDGLLTGGDIQIGPGISLPTVSANPAQMRALLSNLIGNALKYRAPRPVVVDLSASRASGEWTFRLKDNGVGIETGSFGRIFELFERGAHDGVEGHGVGLAICRKIVEEHGGRIWVNSMPGKGSTFYFTLQASDAPAGPPDMTAGSVK